MVHDVVIVGGGPGGLAAALTLGRSRKSVVLFDSGPRRNAAAGRIQNFVTRDGTPPDEFRQIAREQLARYPNVTVRDMPVASITGARGAFQVSVGTETVEARRIVLCTGMIDEMLPIEGFRELWGHAIVQCPYCHAWEVQDRPWGYLVGAEHAAMFLPFALQLRAWTRDLVVYTNGAFEVPDETRSTLQTAGIRLETTPLARLRPRGEALEAVELEGGASVPCEVLFAHPPQRQVDVVSALGLALDEHGFVRVDEMTRETSVPGIYAAGDLTTRMQAVAVASATGMQAAAMINFELTVELVTRGVL